MMNRYVYCVYLHLFSENYANLIMASKRNHKVRDNYALYNSLLAERKSIFSEVIEIKNVGNHPRTLEAPIEVTHPDIPDKMVLLVDVKVNNYSFFQFKLRYKEFLQNPIFRFDSDGDTHWNRIEGIPLNEQQIPTPHFHKFNQDGFEIAYKTDQLLDTTKSKALEDIEVCIAHFFHECNIRLMEDSFPTIKILSNQLGFSYIKVDPNENIQFV